MAENDPWAVIGQAGPRGQAPGIALPGLIAPGPAPAGDGRNGMSVTVAVLYFVSAALQVVWLVIAPSGSPVDPFIHDLPYEDANKEYVILLFVAAGILVLVRRCRVFGLGLAVALPVHWLASFPGNFLPSEFTGPAAQVRASILFICLELAVVAAAVPAAVELRRMLPKRAVSVEASSSADRRRIELVCLGLGALLGGGLWLASGLMSWRVDHYGLVGSGRTQIYTCCDFDSVDSFQKAGVIGNCAVLVAFAVAAALVRSKLLSSAWLLGPGLFGASEIPENAARALLPAQSLFGWSGSEQFPDEWATTTLLPGFWLAVAATLVVIAAAWLRIRIGRPAHDDVIELP